LRNHSSPQAAVGFRGPPKTALILSCCHIVSLSSGHIPLAFWHPPMLHMSRWKTAKLRTSKQKTTQEIPRTFGKASKAFVLRSPTLCKNRIYLPQFVGARTTFHTAKSIRITAVSVDLNFNR
jgi:hypothetical protein